MARLTITLSDERHLALKERAARTGRTIGELIEESLEECGVRSGPSAEELIRAAREQSALDEEDALEIAVEETRAVRRSGTKRDE